MALKTFNLDAKAYDEFSKHCKKHGISMSRKIENFIKQEVARIKSDIDFRLDVEKEIKPGLAKPDNGEHPMGKYC